MTKRNRKLKIIGRIESIDFPEWDLRDIDAKVDTGAYTSSLHCHHIQLYEENGKEYVKFNLLDPTHETYNDILFKWPVFRKKTIKSSNGLREERFIVKTKVKIFDSIFTAQLSLTDRSEMRYPVLLGRKLLTNRFLVDVSQKYTTKIQAQETTK